MSARSFVWIAYIVALLALPVAAQAPDQAQAEARAAYEAARVAMTAGPADVALGGQARLKLPDGHAYIPVKESQRLLAAMGNRVGPGLLGMVFPNNDAPWFVVITFHDAGYVKDDDAKDWKADELLTSIKQGTEAGNEERAKLGIAAIEVIGWVEPPRYDSANQRLVWSASVRDKGAPTDAAQTVNYNTYALGRDGYISLNLITDRATVERDKSSAHELLGALAYNEGKRYADFNSSTDRVAEYGLAALVGGLAAKKLGMFALIAVFLAKFWKIGLVAVVGLSALLPGILKRKKATESSPPPPPAA